MWMSEARISSALVITSDTSRMTGRLGGEVLQLLHVGVERELVALLDVADDLAQLRLAGAVEPLQRRLELGGDRDHRRARAGR